MKEEKRSRLLLPLLAVFFFPCTTSMRRTSPLRPASTIIAFLNGSTTPFPNQTDRRSVLINTSGQLKTETREGVYAPLEGPSNFKARQETSVPHPHHDLLRLCSHARTSKAPRCVQNKRLCYERILRETESKASLTAYL